jgi:hypothetical protein
MPVARGSTPERQDRLVSAPSEVRVTVLVTRRPHRFERSLRALRHLSLVRAVTRSTAALAVVAAIAGAAVGALTDSSRANPHGHPAPAGILAEAAAYRFPLGCLGATLRGDALRKRTGPCWHYGVYVTAELRRVHGVWRLMLDARSDACPRVPLPAVIRELLADCPNRVAAGR